MGFNFNTELYGSNLIHRGMALVLLEINFVRSLILTELKLISMIDTRHSTFTVQFDSSRLRNKHRGMLINSWTFLQGLRFLLERVMHIFFKISSV